MAFGHLNSGISTFITIEKLQKINKPLCSIIYAITGKSNPGVCQKCEMLPSIGGKMGFKAQRAAHAQAARTAQV